MGERVLLSKHRRMFLRLIEQGIDAYLLRTDGAKIRVWGDYENNFANTVEATLYVRQDDLARVDALRRNPILDSDGNLGWFAGLYVVLFTTLVQWLTSVHLSDSTISLFSRYGQYLLPCVYMVFEVMIWLKVPHEARNAIPINLARAFFASFLIVLLLSLPQ